MKIPDVARKVIVALQYRIVAKRTALVREDSMLDCKSC